MGYSFIYDRYIDIDIATDIDRYIDRAGSHVAAATAAAAASAAQTRLKVVAKTRAASIFALNYLFACTIYCFAFVIY